MSGSCKHQKRCGLLWLRLLFIFLNKICKKKNKKKIKKNIQGHLNYFHNIVAKLCINSMPKLSETGNIVSGSF